MTPTHGGSGNVTVSTGLVEIGDGILTAARFMRRGAAEVADALATVRARWKNLPSLAKPMPARCTGCCGLGHPSA